jgi:hypothetical protein
MVESAGAADEWFEVDFDDNTDGIEEESGLTGVPAGLLQQLRERTGTLSRLGFAAKDTSAWYEDGRLTVTLQIRDDHVHVALRALRLEIGESDWIAAWVDPSRYDQDEFELAYPEEQTGGEITDPQQGVDRAIEWLEAQVRRPIVRYVWHDGDRIVGRDWRLADTDRPLVGSGSPELINQPETADERVQIRP